MGNWNINIQGIGCHHNTDNAADADRLAAAFVDNLKAAGHTVEAATFTSGGKTDLSPPVVRELGEIAARGYEAYGESTGGKNFRGDPMPAWGELPPAIQSAWKAASRAIKAMGLLASLALAPAALGQCQGPSCSQARQLVYPLLVRPQAPGPSHDSPAAFLALLNADRARIGRGPLYWDAQLAAYAARNQGVHDPASMAPGAGQCWYSGRSFVGAFHAWKNSPAHWAILMGARSAVGVSLCPTGTTCDAR